MTPDGITPTKTARLRIWRGTDREHGRYEEFNVAYEDGDSVLDGLVRIRLNDDRSQRLWFRHHRLRLALGATSISA